MFIKLFSKTYVEGVKKKKEASFIQLLHIKYQTTEISVLSSGIIPRNVNQIL
jgi:hypothetical protein